MSHLKYPISQAPTLRPRMNAAVMADDVSVELSQITDNLLNHTTSLISRDTPDMKNRQTIGAAGTLGSGLRSRTWFE